MTGAPEFDQPFRPRQKPPVNTVDLLAIIASSSAKCATSSPPLLSMTTMTFSLPSLASTSAVPSVPRGGSLKLASRKKIPNDEEKAYLGDAPIDLDRMARMIPRFQDVYRFAIPLWGQPSDRAISLVHHLWKKRSVEFFRLGAVAAYSEQDSPWLLGKKKIDGTDLLYSPSSPVKKSGLWA